MNWLNPICHFNADSLTGKSDGASVTSWTDDVAGYVGNGSGTSNATYTAQLLGGKPAVTFGGNASFDLGQPAPILAALSSTAYTITAVCRLNVVTAFQALFCQYNNNMTPGLGINYDGVIGCWLGASNALAPLPAAGSFVVMSFVCDPAFPYASAGNVAINHIYVQGMHYGNSLTGGSATNAVAQANASYGNFTLGQVHGTYGAKMDLRHLLIHDRALSPAENLRLAVQAFHEVSMLHPVETCYYTPISQGDSLTAGTGTTNARNGYPVQSATLQSRPLGSWCNLAVSGNTISSIAANASAFEDSLAAEIKKYSSPVLTCWEFYNERSSVADLQLSYGAARKASGHYASVGAITQTDFNPAYNPADKEAFNTDLRNRYLQGYDFLVDFGANATIGVSGAYTAGSATYWTDGVHLNDSGAAIEAQLYAAKLNQLTLPYVQRVQPSVTRNRGRLD